MRLTDLEPQFIRYETRIEDYEIIEGDAATWRERGCPTKTVNGPCEYMTHVGSLADAQGLWFLCPKCYAENIHKLPAGAPDIEGAGIGIHQVQVTFEGRDVKDVQGSHGTNGSPTRWNVSGTGYNDLTTTPSILVGPTCGWHGYITNGEIVNA
jgi:hypothetical protein